MPTSPIIDETSLALFATAAGGPSRAVPFTLAQLSAIPPLLYLVVPDEPFAVGSEYRLDTRRQCPGDAAGLETAAVIRTVAPAAPPLALGAIAAAAPTVGDLEVATSAGSCSTTIRAVAVRVELELSEDARGWAPALSYETFVDGQKWDGRNSLVQAIPFGESWQGPARDMLYAACEQKSGAASGLTEGSHRVVFKAKVLGEGEPVESDPIDVELSCDAPPGLGGAGGSSGVGGGSGTAGTRDVSVEPATAADDGGCACRAAVSPLRTTSGVWLSLALAIGMWRRPRSRPHWQAS